MGRTIRLGYEIAYYVRITNRLQSLSRYQMHYSHSATPSLISIESRAGAAPAVNSSTIAVRVIALALLVLLLISNVACSGGSPPDSLDGNQWQPHKTIPGVLRRDLVGDSSRSGPFKYQLKITAGTRVAVHRHSKDVQVKVLSGSMFIIIGEPLDPSRVQRFAAGSVFVVPAHAWHDEWWDEETVLEAEGVGPSETVYKNQ